MPECDDLLLYYPLGKVRGFKLNINDVSKNMISRASWSEEHLSLISNHLVEKTQSKLFISKMKRKSKFFVLNISGHKLYSKLCQKSLK